MDRILVSIIITALVTSSAEAGGEVRIDAIGKHFPIFVVEKSENPQNILVAYTKLAPDCQIQINSDDVAKPVLDYYWKMDREKYKPVHSLIKRGIRGRFALESTPDGLKGFQVRIRDLSELKHDLEKPIVSVVAAALRPGECEVHAIITLGPSDNSRIVLLSSIHVESKKKLLPPFRQVVNVTVNGTDSGSGERVSRVYSAP